MSIINCLAIILNFKSIYFLMKQLMQIPLRLLFDEKLQKGKNLVLILFSECPLHCDLDLHSYCECGVCKCETGYHHDSNGDCVKGKQHTRLLVLPPANEVWGKVTFSQASVIPFVHGGWCLHPGGVGQTPPASGTIQRAGGTHPTGMHSCLFW